ncbi:hypothetical protein BN2537_15123 [Streptomyces venezuelae]|nr:hypothetical protein BN2537_15123 [Streptomyces venezuelae]
MHGAADRAGGSGAGVLRRGAESRSTRRGGRPGRRGLRRAPRSAPGAPLRAAAAPCARWIK